MEIVGEDKQRFVRRLNEKWLHAVNRKQRKRLQRAGLLPSTRRSERCCALTVTHTQRHRRCMGGKKEKKHKVKVRYPKPGMCVQVYSGDLVIGRERSSAWLVSKNRR